MACPKGSGLVAAESVIALHYSPSHSRKRTAIDSRTTRRCSGDVGRYRRMGCGVKLVIVVGSSSPLEASSPESRAREGERETSRRDYTCLRIIWGQRRRPPSPIARNSPPTSPSVRTPPGAAEAEGEAVRIERAKVSPGVSERLPMEFGC